MPPESRGQRTLTSAATLSSLAGEDWTVSRMNDESSGPMLVIGVSIRPRCLSGNGEAGLKGTPVNIPVLVTALQSAPTQG